MSDMNKDIKAHMSKLNRIQKRFEKTTVDFNDLVIESVKLLWLHKQIAVVNRTMDALSHLKGADQRALATYYTKCIPHTFDKDTGRFGKQSKKLVERMADTWGEYILTTNWYDESKVSESKPYVFDPLKLVTMIDKACIKGEENGGQVTPESLEILAAGINDVLNKHMPEHAEQAEEMSIDDEIAHELKAVNA